MQPLFRQITGGADSFNVFFNGAKVNSPFMTLIRFPISVTVRALRAISLRILLAIAPGQQTIKLSWRA